MFLELLNQWNSQKRTDFAELVAIFWIVYERSFLQSLSGRSKRPRKINHHQITDYLQSY